MQTVFLIHASDHYDHRSQVVEVHADRDAAVARCAVLAGGHDNEVRGVVRSTSGHFDLDVPWEDRPIIGYAEPENDAFSYTIEPMEVK